MDLAPGSQTVRNTRTALVHHNALLREGLCRILHGGGFEVVYQAGSGTELRKGLGDHRPGVILLEWEAPGVGAQLVEELATSLDGTVIVIMSRPDTAGDLSAAFDAGAIGCLSVNLDAREFMAALSMLAHGDILVSHEMVPAMTGPVDEPERPEKRLTPRELDVLRALGRGATNREIAEELFISQHTVKIHVRRVLAKMGCRNRQQAAAYAAAEGLL